MPNFKLRTVDSSFVTEADLMTYPSADDALQLAVRGALMIAVDEADAGVCDSSIEVIVEDDAGHQLRRSAISVSVVPLAIGGV